MPWSNSFSWGQASLRKTECSDIFQNVYSLPPSYRSSLLEPSRAPGRKTHKNVPPSLPRLDPLRVFSSQSWPHWVSRNSSIPVQVFLSQHWFPCRYCLWSFLTISFVHYVSLYPPVCFYNFGSSVFPYSLSSLMDLRRIDDFQFVQLYTSC